VTALIVQDHLGGSIRRGQMVNGSHYWNQLSDGDEVDFTLEQFSAAPRFLSVCEVSRDYILSFSATSERYARLRARVEHAR
jgi:hypothetical protein